MFLSLFWKQKISIVDSSQAKQKERTAMLAMLTIKREREREVVPVMLILEIREDPQTTRVWAMMTNQL